MFKVCKHVYLLNLLFVYNRKNMKIGKNERKAPKY